MATPNAPDLLRSPNPSQVGRDTSLEKLNGQVYTPLPVAKAMLEQVRWPCGGGLLLDPACGDGVFLEAAMRKACRLLPMETAADAIRNHMLGWDLDAEALQACRERMDRALTELGLEDAGGPRIEHRDSLDPKGLFAACVVGNPPYLEAKRMPQGLKARLRQLYPRGATGAFDLYGVFLDRALQLVAHGGETCFILPNRVLVTLATRRLRLHMLQRHQVIVTDLSSERVFEDAADYPVVIHARRSPDATYRVLPARGRRGQGLTLPSAALRERLDGLMPLPPAHPGGQSLLQRLLTDDGLCRLDQRFCVRWTISFHKAGLRDQFTFPPEERPAVPLERVRPFLGGGRFMGNRELAPYRIEPQGWWIDYDTERARAVGNALPPPTLFQGPKAVVCQNARRGRAALDRDELALKDTFLAVKGAEGLQLTTGRSELAWLAWLVLWTNSDLFHYLYEHLYGGTRKGGAYLHFLPRYLNPLPMAPPPAGERAMELLHEVRDDPSKANKVERELRQAWRITAAEAQALDEYDYPAH